MNRVLQDIVSERFSFIFAKGCWHTPAGDFDATHATFPCRRRRKQNSPPIISAHSDMSARQGICAIFRRSACPSCHRHCSHITIFNSEFTNIESNYYDRQHHHCCCCCSCCYHFCDRPAEQTRPCAATCFAIARPAFGRASFLRAPVRRPPTRRVRIQYSYQYYHLVNTDDWKCVTYIIISLHMPRPRSAQPLPLMSLMRMVARACVSTHTPPPTH